METGIARQAGTSMQQHKPSPSLSKQTEIVKLLTKFSLSRRAAINPETLALDAADLSIYGLNDIAEGLEIIRKRERADGESAYPDIGTIEGAVKGVIRRQRDQDALDKENARVNHFKAHPELYMSKEEVAELNQKIADKLGFERKREIDTTPVMMNCPHCSRELPVGPNIRFWTVQELRDYASVLERNQATREIVNG